MENQFVMAGIWTLLKLHAILKCKRGVLYVTSGYRYTDHQITRAWLILL